MSHNDPGYLKKLLSAEAIAEIEHWRSKYPGERKRPPIIEALKVAQKENNQWLSQELMDAVADYLDVPRIGVYEVATFYTMFHLKPVGKHVISVCTNLSCSLCGSHKIVQHLEDKLGVKLGQTTNDGLFTLKEVECMAACGGAPMLEVQEEFHENLTIDKVDALINELREQEVVHE